MENLAMESMSFDMNLACTQYISMEVVYSILLTHFMIFVLVSLVLAKYFGVRMGGSHEGSGHQAKLTMS